MSAVNWLFVFVSGALIGAAVAYTACNWRRLARRLELHRDWPLEFEQEPFGLRLVSTVRLLPPVRDWEREKWL